MKRSHVAMIVALSGFSILSATLIFRTWELKRELNREVLAYENLLSEKLHLEKQYRNLLTEWAMVRPAKVDSLKMEIWKRDQELARLTEMIRKLNGMVDSPKKR